MKGETINMGALVICLVLLTVGLVGGFFIGRGIQGKDYRSAIEQATRMESLVGELSDSIAEIRASYEGATSEVAKLRETYAEALDRIVVLRRQLEDILRDNHVLADEIGRLELELNQIRNDISGVANDIGSVIDGAEADEK